MHIMTHYRYRHQPGYGGHDHMADEIIARAARRLGLDTGAYITQAAGYAAHGVPMAHAVVRLPVGRGVQRRMADALRWARLEVTCRDCRIVVVPCGAGGES